MEEQDEGEAEGGLIIPPLLHQMWISAPGRGGPSRRNLAFVKQTKERFRGYRYTFWGSVDKLFNEVDELGKYRGLYERATPHICKCDIARYMVLYARGGVYSDLDVNFERELPDWMVKRELLFFLEYDHVKMPLLEFEGVNLVPSHVTNSLMASRPRHPFWLRLLDEIEHQFSLGFPTNPTEVMYYTGPRRLALQLMEELSHEVYPIQSQYRPLPSYFMDRRTRHPERIATLEHHYGSTWKMESYLGMLVEFYRDSYLATLMALVLAISMVILVKEYGKHSRFKFPPV